LKSLLNKLAVLNPEEGLLGEVGYWKSIDSILTAARKETNESFVEGVL